MRAIQMRSFNDPAIDGEAKRYANKHGIDDIDDYLKVKASIAHKHFKRSIEPLIQMKVKIVASANPKIAYYPDSRMVLSLIDEMIEREAKNYGITPVVRCGLKILGFNVSTFSPLQEHVAQLGVCPFCHKKQQRDLEIADDNKWVQCSSCSRVLVIRPASAP